MKSNIERIAATLKPRINADDPSTAIIKTRSSFSELEMFLAAKGIQPIAFREGSYYRHALVWREQFEERSGLLVETPEERDARRGRNTPTPPTPATLDKREKLVIGDPSGVMVSALASSPLAFTFFAREFKYHVNPFLRRLN